MRLSKVSRSELNLLTGLKVLVGVYIAGYQGDRATLTLRADRTFTNSIQLRDGEVVENRGMWKASNLSPKFRQTVVAFSDFRVFPSFSLENLNWATEAQRTWFWQIELCFDSDVGYCYVKKGNS